MTENRSIANRFTNLNLVLLVSFFLFVVGATTVMELFRIEKQLHVELHTQAQTRLKILNQEINNQRVAVTRTAESQLSINSLIDISGSSLYFDHALEDLTQYTAIDDAQLFDYAGNLLNKSSSHPSWYSAAFVREALVTGKGDIKLHNGAFFIVEPITYFGAVQGGIIARVNLSELVSPVLENIDRYYSLKLGEKTEFTNGERHRFESIAFMVPSSDMTLSDFSISITLSEPYLYLLHKISPWLTSFSILALISLFPIVAIARRWGKKMALPIAQLSEKVEEGTYPIALSHTAIELEVLANAFNRTTEQINKAGELNLEAERQSGQSQLLAIVDTVVDSIITIDEKGYIATFNPAAEGLFGYYADEVIGKKVNMLMPQDFALQHDTFLTNYLDGKPAKIIGIGREIVAKRKDGSEFPAELSVSEMRVLGARMFTGIIRDITARKKAQSVKNEFVATVSHELRTPLTSIRGALGVVLGKFGNELPEKSKKMLTIALRNSERLTLLINDILDIEKLDSGQLSFSFSRINLDSLIRRSIDDNDGFARQHNVSLVYINEINDAYVNADSGRVLQVMANLLSNAIKYSPEYGEVTITLAQQDSFYRIDVTDVGSGIPPEFHQRIFERFSQADSSDTRRVGGTGLGLSITQSIVEGHKGQIDFFSALDEGSTFYFTLPIDTNEAKRVSAHREGGITQFNAVFQVLYVGKDDHLTHVLRGELAEIAEISCVSSFQSAILAFKQQHFELVILDNEWDEESITPFLSSMAENANPVILISETRLEKTLPTNVISCHEKSQLNIDKLKSEVRLILKKTFPKKAV
ncbi:PAS domain S-box protein [Enterovibrio calviensis]|uniref:PAS domain S-box protein n=1 Tax=Enterovibrio calviensis TaxID=91359 RepID=UPI003735FFC2